MKPSLLLIAFLFTWSLNCFVSAEDMDSCRVIIEASEIDIEPYQLCIVPNNGIFLLTGNELISLEDNEKMSILSIQSGLLPEEIVFTENDILVKNDTMIVSCGETLTPIITFNTNQFHLLPTTDNNVFVLSKTDSLYLLFFCDVVKKEVTPFIKFAGDIEYVVGDTARCLFISQNHVYSVLEKRVLPLLNFYEPIITATLTQYGLIFATENGIFFLESMNHVALIADKGCRRLLSDTNTLYIYYDDGTLFAYSLDLLRPEKANED